MQIKIGILEDEDANQLLLRQTLDNWAAVNDCTLDFSCYSSAEELEKEMKLPDFDVMFLDIQLTGKTGLDAAHTLRERQFKGDLIFLTAFHEYALEGYSVHPMNFLLKPVSLDKVTPCMNDIKKKLSNDMYFYRTKSTIQNIPYMDILCFESSMHYVSIITADQSYQQYTSLNALVQFLPGDFVRCHRTTIVNLYHIMKIDGMEITLSNGKVVNISRSYYEDVKRHFVDFCLRLRPLSYD